MRISLIITILLVSIGFVTADAAHAQTISLSVKNAPLKDVVAEIEKQSGYEVFYNNKHFENSRTVTLTITRKGMKEVLDACFKSQPLYYEIVGKTIVIKPKPVKPLQKAKGTKTTLIDIEGTVTDENDRPLFGATVKVKESNKTTTTDNEGKFLLSDVDQDAVLVISYVGYQSAEIRPDGTITVKLRLASSNLNEVSVVSTGYQAIPKERSTGSFVQINNELLNRRVSTNIIDRLEGVVPGLIFNRNTASSISGTDLSIRGHSTIFANDQPLIVIDNFPYDGNINNVNPNDIESISILKDAAAASIWGVRSGNGVIVITTKKAARNSRTSVELNSNIMVRNKPDLFYSPDFLDANNFINTELRLYAQGFYDSDLTNPSQPVISPVVEILSSDFTQAQKEKQIDAYRNFDVRDNLTKYLYRKSINQQYNINVKGGSSNSDYFISAGFDNNRSNQLGNSEKRLTLNSIYNFSLTKWLDLSLGLNYIQSSGTSNSPLANLNPGAKDLYPYAQIADEAHNPLAIVKNYSSRYTDAAQQNGFLDWKYRPLDELNYNENKSSLADNRINAGLKYTVIDGLDISLKYQYEKSRSEISNYSSKESYSARNLINRFTQNQADVLSYPVPIGGGILDEQSLNLQSHRLRAQANFNRAWQDHEVTAIAGAEISDISTDSDGNTVYGYNQDNGAFRQVNVVDFFTTNPSGSSQIPSGMRFGSLSDRYLSYFGNGSYSFRKKYVLSVSGRIDRSNLFGVNTNQKAVPLYSIGGSWEMSREDFYHISLLPYSRLRLTYGHNGNVDKSLTAYTVIRQLNNTDVSLTGPPYAQIVTPGNPQLRWEKVAIFNIGLDFALKDRVLSGSVEYYRKKGIDLIGDAPLPPSLGFDAFRGNVAQTRGNGLDVTLTIRNISSGAFKWETTGIFSYVTDKVTRYDVEQTVNSTLTYGTGNNGIILPLVNRPMFGLYSYRWAGLDSQNGDPRGYINGQISKDYNAILSQTPLDSLQYSGTSRPKIFGSVRNTLSYKNISFSANIIYKLDYYFRRSSISYSALYQSWSGHSDYTKRWQSPGDELRTDVPSEAALPIDGGRESFYTSSAALVSKGDHIRLQDITLSYDLNNKWLERTPFKSLRVYSYINNVGILWRANKHGLDPDLFSSAYFPQPRTISFGIKSQF